MIRIGLDIGSTTLKCVALDENDNIIYKEYRRHFSRIAENAVTMLESVGKALSGGAECSLVISGSAGMGLSERLGFPFAQEVFATRIAVKKFIPDCDIVIELGGEDAKILFLGEDTEVRMNGSCAGGTGAFIDQMATLLNISADEMSIMAKNSTRTYTIASRCGVFAKSDIQPLINQGANKDDICASIFGAVVNQTVAGLAQGRPLEGKIVYLGGPLTFLPALRDCFDETLDTKGICPENSLYYVSLGAAMSGMGIKGTTDEYIAVLKSYSGSGDYKFCPPLFASKEEYERFKERHAKAVVPVLSPEEVQEPLFVSIGIDAGSTTVKAVATDENENIIYTRYQANSGDPVSIVLAILKDFFSKYPSAHVVSSCVTGYGEEIIKSAFSLDYGIVETVAHFTAAKKFDPAVDFIIDIGGQDIKCFKIRNGVIDNIFLNEACSSGCGSFLQTFAGALGYNISDFASLGLFAEKPVDLGSRCTVFMNSSVKQAQKDGAGIENISAGLSISVVKNALYKVIRASSADDLGKRIVVQGGTFLNDAVLRAFEQELGTQVTRPAISGLMGAYGAALYALRNRPAKSTAISSDELDSFSQKSSTVTCKGCTNACRLYVSTFPGGRTFISGNKCERPLLSGERKDHQLPNLYDYKRSLLESYKPVAGARGRIGIPMGLNFYENLPFWHTFFTALGFEVVTSHKSTRELYIRGQATIPSDTVCYPAKLIHGHIDALLRFGIDTVFYPCMSYNFDEGLSDNHYNCPVVAYYPEVVAANMKLTEKCNFIYDYVDPSRTKDFTKKMSGVLSKHSFDIPKSEIKSAADAAYAEYNAYMEKVRRKGDEVLALAEKQGFPVIVLCGRPYHLDPEINHGIDGLICSMGAAVISEDALGHRYSKAHTSVLNQWTYHARLYAAAELVSASSRLNLIQLVSFGCGIDAITTDEVRAILEKRGKIYTQIKIDEITNLGAVKIRLRSLFSALEQEHEGKSKK